MYLDWEDRPNKVYVIDIETDDLNATVIWVMCWQDARTREKGTCIGHKEIKDWFNSREADAVYVGHNILKFDAPVLARIIGANVGVANCVDTLVLSTLYSPSLVGGHSLEAWGQRLGAPKQDFHDWSGLSDKMIEYCQQDVEITAQLFRRLVRTLNKIEFSERSVWLQHHLTCIVERQRKTGFKFNGVKALNLYSHLRHREEELESEVRDVFPSERVFVAQRQLYKKDGSPTAIYLKDQERYHITKSNDGRTYLAHEDVEFSLGSPKQRVDKLLSLGWVPREFTDAGNPKPFDKGKLSPSLEEFLDENPVPEVLLIAKWMSFNGRANMINTWLDNWNEKDGCIHGKLFVADTLRFRHQAPNTANIPAVRISKDKQVLRGEDGFYTYESRDCWEARSGRVLVGTDAAGLELRMLAHFLDRPAFTEQVVEGDPHQYNADTVGITRPEAKTLIYAIMYGAGDVKIARTLGLPVLRGRRRGELYEYSPEGKQIKEMFLERLGIGDLMSAAKREQQNGRVELVDGSKVICPSPHAALNYKLQGSGARVMGLGSVLLERDIERRNLDSLKVGDIHDEWQYDCASDDADEHGERSVQAIRTAGTRLSLNVPLDAEFKKGKTWACTH